MAVDNDLEYNVLTALKCVFLLSGGIFSSIVGVGGGAVFSF